MPTIPKKVEDRLIKAVPRFQKLLQDARDRDVNESDTVTIIKDMLEDVFGFDKYTEVTSEFAINRTYCDLATKIDGEVFTLIEAKAIGLTLRDNHLRQAVGYGANNGIEWVVLSNGIVWELYSVKCEGRVTHEQICSFNFLEINPRKKEDREKLFLLCRKGAAKNAIEEYQQHVEVVNRFVIGAILQSELVLKLVRRELKRLSPNAKTTEDHILAIIEDEIIKRDIKEGEAADSAAKKVRKAARKILRKKSPTASTTTTGSN